jgi:hypothetical protein
MKSGKRIEIKLDEGKVTIRDYGMIAKLKEYLLKDKLISLLTIKDLIQPLVMLIKVEKNTSAEDATKLALRAEQLINNYVDTSSFLTGSFSVQELIQLLVDNIKVLPDYNDSMTNLSPLDLSKLTDKIDKMRSEQDATKEDLLNSTAVPLDLFTGRASSWEALKTSERLNSKVNQYIKIIKLSMQMAAKQLLYIYTKKDINLIDIKVNIFSKTSIEYNNAQANSDVISSLLDSIRRIIEDAETFAKSSNLINKRKYLEYVRKNLYNIDPELLDIISDEEIIKFIEMVKEESANDSTNF